MSRLDGLRKNITEMSIEELREHIRHIRADRKISKAKVTVKKAKAVRSDKAKSKVGSALNKLSADELKALVAAMEGLDGTEGS
jgi:hypothetical protein